MEVDLNKVVAHLRQRHTAHTDQLLHENAVLAAAVDMLHEKVERLTKQVADARGETEPGA
ncbi:hypothetical protein [Nonomuraea typhae]|uniref:DUF904 domain-containing protein n=1 Tax=Nonomuraea typhae TaxID=2603600 RepID=A0ABW7YMY2_9ACTN